MHSGPPHCQTLRLLNETKPVRESRTMVDNVANTKHHWPKYTTEVYLKLNSACLPDTIYIISNLSLSIGSFFKFLLCICLDMIIDFYRQRPLQQLEMEKKRKQPDSVWRLLKRRIYQNGTHRLVKIQTTISLDRLKLIRYSQTLYHHDWLLVVPGASTLHTQEFAVWTACQNHALSELLQSVFELSFI